MRPRHYIIALFSLIAVAVCVRLGFWQLARLAEKRADNKIIESRLGFEPVAANDLDSDTAKIRFRRVTVSGKYDYDHEVVLVNRVRSGSPGVHIVTPLNVEGSDTAFLINRGWVYAPDGITVDLTPWREVDSLIDGYGFVLPMSDTGVGVPTTSSRKNGYRWLTLDAVAGSVPYPVHPYVIVLSTPPVGSVDSAPPRIPIPELSEGAHKSYAMQWFSFAIVFLVGTVLFFMKELGKKDNE